MFYEFPAFIRLRCHEVRKLMRKRKGHFKPLTHYFEGQVVNFSPKRWRNFIGSGTTFRTNLS